MGDECFLIEKRGLYYRPKSAGYTGIKREAGRYTFDEAAVHGGPNGPDGGLDGISIWKEADAPDFSRACSWDVRFVEEARQEGIETLRTILSLLDSNASRDNIRRVIEGALSAD